MPRGALVRSQVLHLNSYHRVSGTPWDFVVSLPHGLIRADENHTIVCEPVQVVVNRSWYTIDETNNTFQIFDGDEIVDYVIPTGFYNVRTFMTALAALLPTWTVGWDPIVSKFNYFAPAGDDRTYKFLFPTWLCGPMGFELGSEHEVSRATGPLRSTQPVRMMTESVLLVHTDLPKASNASVNNLLGSETRETSIVAKVPITAPPYDNLVWRSNAPNILSFELATQAVSQMRVWLTDEFDRQLRVAYDWTMTLRIEYHETASEVTTAVRLLGSLRDYARFMLLDNKKASGSDGNTQEKEAGSKKNLGKTQHHHSSTAR